MAGGRFHTHPQDENKTHRNRSAKQLWAVIWFEMRQEQGSRGQEVMRGEGARSHQANPAQRRQRKESTSPIKCQGPRSGHHAVSPWLHRENGARRVEIITLRPVSVKSHSQQLFLLRFHMAKAPLRSLFNVPSVEYS